MLRRSLRWFSKNWTSGTTEELIPSIIEFFSATPPPKNTLIMTGPRGTGKSTMLQMAFASATKSKDPDMFLNVRFSDIEAQKPTEEAKTPDPEAESVTNPMEFIDSFNQSVVRGIEYLQRKNLLPNPAKQELISMIHNYAKKVSILSQDFDKRIAESVDGANLFKQRSEEKQIGLDIINRKIGSYRNVIKLTDVEYSGFQHAIDKIDISDAFDIVATSILVFKVERQFGELSSSFLVDMLNLIGKSCHEANTQPPILAIAESHFLFCYPKSIQFLEYLLNEFITKKNHFYSVIEGQTLLGGPLSIVDKYNELFSWCNVKENNEIWFRDYVQNRLPSLTDSEMNEFWDFVNGNPDITEKAVTFMEKESIPFRVIMDWMRDSLIDSVNQFFADFETADGPSEQGGILQQIMNIDFPRTRAAAYFLYKLCEEKNNEIDVTIQDMAENFVIGRLCVGRLIYFNSSTMKLGFDKKNFTKILPQTEIWKYNQNWAERAKNKIAYNKMAQEKLQAIN